MDSDQEQFGVHHIVMIIEQKPSILLLQPN